MKKTMLIAATATLMGVASGSFAQDGLVVGFDDTTSGSTIAWIRNAGAWEPLFTYDSLVADVWGLATDPNTCTLYVVSGTVLYKMNPGGPLTQVATVTLDGATVSPVGLAWHNGQLIATRNVTDEGFYSIDVTTGVATRVWTQTVGGFPTAWDFGGIDADGGTLYGITDTSPTGSIRGLYSIDLETQTLTPIVATPIFPGNPGTTPDVDGLAVGARKAYFVPDQPGDIAVFDLASGQFDTPITNPFPTTEVFSAGAWAPCLLDGSCTADFNGDTIVDFFDYLDFVAAFAANEPVSDFNADTVVDFFDYLDFVAAFAAGC